jgi:hypothetical protein
MTHQHPATPTSQEIDKFFMLPLCEEERLTAAFCAGADQEHEASCEWLSANAYRAVDIGRFRHDRRPKPPNLKQQALDAHKRSMFTMPGDGDTILRALELLPDETTP